MGGHPPPQLYIARSYVIRSRATTCSPCLLPNLGINFAVVSEQHMEHSLVRLVHQDPDDTRYETQGLLKKAEQPPQLPSVYCLRQAHLVTNNAFYIVSYTHASSTSGGPRNDEQVTPNATHKTSKQWTRKTCDAGTQDMLRVTEEMTYLMNLQINIS